MQLRKVVLSSDAICDLRSIRKEVERRAHSKKVADDYLKKIRRHLRFLECTAAACPRYISTEKNSATDIRTCVTERHIAFFTFDDQYVYVKRVLHQRMDYEAHLSWN